MVRRCIYILYKYEPAAALSAILTDSVGNTAHVAFDGGFSASLG